MAASTAIQVLVSPLLGTVFDNLSSLINKEFGLIWGVNKDLEKLSSTLSTIRDVLEDAESKQITNKPICNWLRKLKNVAYDAEDVLDEFATDAALRHDHHDMSCNNFHEVLPPQNRSTVEVKAVDERGSSIFIIIIEECRGYNFAPTSFNADRDIDIIIICNLFI